MRAIVQRVDRVGVTVAGRLVSSIGKGILVFLGIESGDDRGDADYILEKILNLRIFEDEAGKMNQSLLEKSLEMLIVPQFTLLGDCRRGRRPSFAAAEEPARARLLYDYFLSRGRKCSMQVGAGEFQAAMKIELINDGPVTIMLDSKKKF